MLAKLKSPGAKLLTGPRGSGKSTLLLSAYFELLEGSEVFPIYVNYSRSLALEPLFHHNANALAIFRQWVLMKIIVGARDAVDSIEAGIPDKLAELVAEADHYIHELGVGHEPPDLTAPLTPERLTKFLESWAKGINRRRVVLLFDDAAHVFSSQQQREFFEIFRELRSSHVSAKAAVYPGITSYSPYMHVGHEAELIEAWYRPDADDYLPTMQALLQRRLPAPLLRSFKGREELVDYLALASFGLPRGFLVMLRQCLGVEEDEKGFGEGPVTIPTRKAADDAVAAYAQTVRHIFGDLAKKVPRYRHFVEVGTELERSLARAISRFNKDRDIAAKAVAVGIADPITPELSRVLEMLEMQALYARTARFPAA